MADAAPDRNSTQVVLALRRRFLVLLAIGIAALVLGLVIGSRAPGRSKPYDVAGCQRELVLLDAAAVPPRVEIHADLRGHLSEARVPTGEGNVLVLVGSVEDGQYFIPSGERLLVALSLPDGAEREVTLVDASSGRPIGERSTAPLATCE